MSPIFSLITLVIASLLGSSAVHAAEVGLAKEVPDHIVQECEQTTVAQPEYKGQVIHIGYNNELRSGELSKVKVQILNQSNVTWFSDDSFCKLKPPVRLGTTRDDNRPSIFWTRNLLHHSAGSEEEDINDAWVSADRIKMKQDFVPPNGIATFEFYVRAPHNDDVYIEYFKPVAENIDWVEGAEVSLSFKVGRTTPEQEARLPAMLFSTRSDTLSVRNKNIIVDISEQKIYLRIGNRVLYTFPVSTGTYRTPTPIGTTKIYSKQELRISKGWPHYIMPLYMAFRANGAYGIHALPSLANDRGVFWREALNHIGERRSHGCIRLLPWDAETAYAFVEVGTKMVVRP